MHHPEIILFKNTIGDAPSEVKSQISTWLPGDVCDKCILNSCRFFDRALRHAMSLVTFLTDRSQSREVNSGQLVEKRERWPATRNPLSS